MFCVQVEQDAAKWDALDLNQWRFYLLTRGETATLGCASLSLNTIASVRKAMTADELRAEARRAIALVSSTNES